MNGLPIAGSPIRVFTKDCLTAHRGKLLSRCPGKGVPVYAASFIRQREIVADCSLRSNPDLLRLILLHEVFHFVWVRLDNGRRNEFAALLVDEGYGGARGELGESSAVLKSTFRQREQAGSRRWREYVCESFCDTAACLYSGLPIHEWFTLAERWRRRRESWFFRAGVDGWKC